MRGATDNLALFGNTKAGEKVVISHSYFYCNLSRMRFVTLQDIPI